MAQTLTVNKVQETSGGQTLDSTNVIVGIPMHYRITITSSDGSKNPLITVTDTLPSLFTLLQVDCAGLGGATCPNNSASQLNINTNISLTGNSLVISNLKVPAGSGTSLELRVIGYFTAPSQSLIENKVEAIRQGETVAENTAKDSVSLTIPLHPLPVDLEVTKTAMPATGTTSTIGITGTTHHYKVAVKNISTTDVYLGGFALTDVLRLASGTQLNYKLTNFICPQAACPALSSGLSFNGVLSSSPAFNLTFASPGLLMGGASLTLEFDAEFDNPVTCGSGSTTIRNDAFLTLANSSTSIADTNAMNNTGTVDVTSSYSLPPCGVNPTVITKTQVSPANPVTWGQNITYKIDFKNNGTTALANLGISDFLLPSNQAPAFTASIATAPTCVPACTSTNSFPLSVLISGNQQLFAVTIPTIPAGQGVTITFVVKFTAPCDMVSGSANIPVTNRAATTSGVFFDVPTTMTPLPDCGLQATKKLLTANPVVFGQPVEFQMTFSNPFSQPVTVRTLKDAITLTSANYGDLPITIVASSCPATPLLSVTPLPSPVASNSTATIKHNTPPWNGLLLINSAPARRGCRALT